MYVLRRYKFLTIKFSQYFSIKVFKKKRRNQNDWKINSCWNTSIFNDPSCRWGMCTKKLTRYSLIILRFHTLNEFHKFMQILLFWRNNFQQLTRLWRILRFLRSWLNDVSTSPMFCLLLWRWNFFYISFILQ